MDIILDPSFFQALLQTVNIETENYRDFERFIKRLKNLNLIIKCSSVDHFYQMVKEDPYLELLINSSPLQISESDSLLEDIKLQEFYEGGSCYKLFFLSESANECSKLSQQFGYEYISPDNFEQRWNTYKSTRPDLACKVTKRTTIPEKIRFDSWDCLDDFAHPVNCILINDSYILNDQPNQKIRDNLLPLLKKLLLKASTGIPIEIIIFADPAPARQLNYKEIHNYLTKELDYIIGQDRYNLYLVRYSKHKRFILTNYFLIKCDNSFNFFRANGHLISDSPWIDFNFIFSSWDSRLADDLAELKEKLGKLENSAPDAAYEVINYYPDKGNRLLESIEQTD